MNVSRSNIKFNYLYRDGGNYKVWGSEVFSNPDMIQLNYAEEKIRKSLIDGEFFDPTYWKVKRLKYEDWVSELDHSWNEFDSIENTLANPTTNYSITEFLTLITMRLNTRYCLFFRGRDGAHV
ncbi:MAG: hypothetical protein JNM78_06580 [Cyclobacteriaceae bacterium]|nr:hypothetical protein [Cyclobacteriaceae bacterium]